MLQRQARLGIGDRGCGARQRPNPCASPTDARCSRTFPAAGTPDRYSSSRQEERSRHPARCGGVLIVAIRVAIKPGRPGRLRRTSKTKGPAQRHANSLARLPGRVRSASGGGAENACQHAGGASRPDGGPAWEYLGNISEITAWIPAAGPDTTPHLSWSNASQAHTKDASSPFPKPRAAGSSPARGAAAAVVS